MHGKVLHIIAALLVTGQLLCAQGVRDGRNLENVLIDGVADMNRGDLKNAISKFNHVFQKDSLNDAACYYLGICQYSAGKHAEAERLISRAYALDSLNSAYADALAAVYSGIGRADKAADLYERLIERFPGKYNTPYILTMLGDKALTAYSDSLAMDRYERALELDPGYAPATLGKAEVYRVRNNTPAFFSTLDGFVRNPDVMPSAKCHYVENVLKSVDGRMFRGLHVQLDSLVSGCVTTHPNDSSALKLAGQWYYGTDRKELGTRYLERWADGFPHSREAQSTRVYLRFSDKDWAGVIMESEKVISNNPQDKTLQLEMYSGMGDAYHEMGNSKLAFRSYEKALKIDPEYVPILNNYAYYLSIEGKNLAKAEKMSRITVEKEPDNATYLDTYGWILFLQKKYTQAKPYFKHAMLYGGKDSDVILEHYSLVLKALGEMDLSNYYKGLAESRRGQK